MNEFLILYTLKDSKSNIYQIKKNIDTKFAPYIQISTGAIIPALNRLEKAELIKVEKQVSQGGLRKSYYSILPKSEEFFNAFLSKEISSSSQLARVEIQVLLLLVDDKNFSDQEKELLKNKVTNGIQNLIKKIQKTLALNEMNNDFLQADLSFWEKVLAKLS